MGRKRKPLTKKETETLKRVLVGEKEGLTLTTIYTSDEFNLSQEDRSDEIDQANADVSNAQRLRFRNREVFYERKIEKALIRIEEGTYGTCEECDEPIGFKRLMARPTAEQCILCKEESERDESASIFGKKSKSLGKQINLVANL